MIEYEDMNFWQKRIVDKHNNLFKEKDRLLNFMCTEIAKGLSQELIRAMRGQMIILNNLQNNLYNQISLFELDKQYE